jgi:Tfp pilus assembly PilM family ATPase
MNKGLVSLCRISPGTNFLLILLILYIFSIKLFVKYSIGLDISNHCIKAVQLNDNKELVKFGRIDLIQSEEKIDRHTYISKITELFRIYKIPKENVIANLRGSVVLTRTYLPSLIIKEDFDKWFIENIESMIPGTPLNDVIFDHQVLDSGRILISFARLSAVIEKLFILKTCDIVPRIVCPSSLALQETLVKNRRFKNNRTFAILDFDFQGSDLLIINEGRPFFSTEIGRGNGYLHKGKEQVRILKREITADLKKCFDFHQEKDNVNIEALMLTGSVARIPGIKKNLREATGLKVESANPFMLNEIKLPPDFFPAESAQYTQALGLALMGLRKEKTVNLIPLEQREDYRRWQTVKKINKISRKALFLALPVLLAVLSIFTLIMRNHDKLSNQVRSLRNQKDELTIVDSETKTYKMMLEKLEKIKGTRFIWSKILYNLGTAVPEGIILKEINTENRMVSSGATPYVQQVISIAGEARNSEMVVSYVKSLEKNYTRIKLDKISEGDICTFRLSLNP